MADFAIRRATEADAEAILRCLHTAFAPFEQYYSPEGYRDTTLTEATVRERLRTMSLYVATSEGGEVIGTIGCNLLSVEEGHIRGMAVLEAWQGQGVAQALLDVVVAELRDRGCAFISLDTTAPLQRAMRFYEKNGFVRSAKVGDHFGMPLYEYVKRLR
jgi:GNAT superfamily N-acetyltransferase